jgi:hypothetical protein
MHSCQSEGYIIFHYNQVLFFRSNQIPITKSTIATNNKIISHAYLGLMMIISDYVRIKRINKLLMKKEKWS